MEVSIGLFIILLLILLSAHLIGSKQISKGGIVTIGASPDLIIPFFKRFLVREHEKAILYKEQNFVKILESGVYWIFDPRNIHFIQHYDLKTPEFRAEIFDYLLKKRPDIIANYFTVVDLADNQAALLYKDNKLTEILPPATRRAYWKGIVDITTDIIDVEKNYEIPADKIYTYIGLPNFYNYIEDIKNNQVGLLYVDSKFVRILEPGLYGFWKYKHIIEVKRLDLRVQLLEIQGQEIISNDKATLRINLNANYQITDPQKVMEKIADYKDYLYKELQMGLREIVGTNSLDEILSKKEEINKMVFESVKGKITEYGMELIEVGIKDIILPGDMRDIMNQVVEAEKKAQANLIKRREETAATRSLLNTVKVMENNPLMLRLKELETLEKITEKINSINIYGGLDGLLNELVKIRNNEKPGNQG